jgi:hypothetical protein
MDVVKTLLNTKLSEIPAKDLGFKAVFEVDGYKIVVEVFSGCCHGPNVAVAMIEREEGQGSTVKLYDVRRDATIGEIYQRAKELIETFVRRPRR